MNKAFVRKAVIVLVVCIVMGLLLCMAYVQWRPSIQQFLQVGLVERDGVVHELPRTEEPMGAYHTRLFDRREFETKIDGKRHALTYFWRAPEVAPADGQEFPLVVILHGRPGIAYAAKFLVTDEMAQKYPAYIMVPVLREGRTWALPANKDVKLPALDHSYRESLTEVVDMVEEAIRKFPVDENKVYILGCSEGGIGAFGAATRYARTFAAAIAMSGVWDPAEASKLARVPLLIMNGTRDQLVPIAATRSLVQAIRNKGGRTEYVEFPNLSHDCSAGALYNNKRMWEWLFFQDRRFN